MQMAFVNKCDYFDLYRLHLFVKMRYNGSIDRKISKDFSLVGFLRNRRNQ